MAVNLEALRKKLAQLNGEGSRKNAFWRPEKGKESVVRLISFPDNDGQPFKELWFYYNIGSNRGLLSPNQYGKPDPIQELINKLRAQDTKEGYELCKKLYPKMRSYVPVIVRGEEDKGVRLWGFGKQVYQDLITTMLDSDFGDITDPKNGFDIKVTVTQPAGQQYAKTTPRARPVRSPLSEDKKQAKEWLDAIPNLDDLFTLKSYDELENIINAWLENPDDDAPSAPRHSPKKADESEEKAGDAAKPSTFQELDDAFADLDKM